MKQWIFSLLSLLPFFSSLQAVENLLAPNLLVNLTMPPMGDRNAFSFLGEFGEKNIRGSANYGVYINPSNRIEFTGELLLQKLKYHFHEGTERRWMTQYAVGAAYQYLLLHNWIESFDISAAFSHAFNRGVSVESPYSARIAGSDGVLSGFGTTFNFWDCGYLSCALNYDFVNYLRHYEKKEVANGFGGSLYYIQYLPHGFSFDMEADFRRPFYYYAGSLSWYKEFTDFGFELGAYANYTNGKESLPNALAAGLQISFSFGSTRSGRCVYAPDSFTANCEATAFCDLATWAAKPAIYTPMVFAIADQENVVP